MLLVSAKIILSDCIVKMNISLILIGILLIFEMSRKIEIKFSLSVSVSYELKDSFLGNLKQFLAFWLLNIPMNYKISRA